MKGRLLLDVVIRESSAILQLLSGEDQSLLVWWDSLLVLDLGLDVLDSVSWLDIKGDGLTSESLDEDLHTTSESEDEMEGGLLLDVVIGESSAVFELLSSEDESLLIWRNTFLVLDLSLDILDGVSWLDVQGDGLSGKGLNEDLHLFVVKDLIIYCFSSITSLNSNILSLQIDNMRLKNHINVAINTGHQ